MSGFLDLVLTCLFGEEACVRRRGVLSLRPVGCKSLTGMASGRDRAVNFKAFSTQIFQNPSTKEGSLNDEKNPYMIQGTFLS